MAKKNRTIYLIFTFLLILHSSSKDCFANSVWRKVENKAFKTRERLTYIVKWKGVAGGISVMELKKIMKISDRDVYHATLSTRSSRLMDIFFKVDDLLESYIDKEGIFTWKQRKRLRGGKYRADRETIYDQVNHQAYYGEKKIDIPYYVQDSLSAFYYLRTMELRKGDIITIDANDDGKNYLVEVKVMSIEPVSTPWRKVEALKTEVVWKGEGKPQGENSLVWFTNDEKKVPVKIEKGNRMGTVTMVLKKAKF